MVAGGCAKPCTGGDTYGLLATLANNITAQIPGSDTWLIPYTGSATEAASDSPTMISTAETYMASCPKTPIVFLGYSLGGIVIMNTMCGGVPGGGLPAGYTNVIAAITYG